jgi:hypothetical protein
MYVHSNRIAYETWYSKEVDDNKIEEGKSIIEFTK